MSRFDLSRWFAGIASVTDEQRARHLSPEADARVRRAVDALPVTLFEFDASGRYTCAAGKHIGMFGISAAHVIGRSVFEFPRFVPGKNVMVRRALAGEVVTFAGVWPLGRFMIRLEPRFDEDGKVESVIGIGYELAKSTEADDPIAQLLEALRQSEARFRAMCESAPLGIFVGNAKLELGYVNPALCSMLERSSDELIGRHFREALHADDELLYRPSNLGAQGGGYDGVMRLARKGGTRLWASLRIAELREGGELLGYVGAVTDITEERAARLAIDRAQQDLRRVIESSPEGIAVVRDGSFVFVNRSMAEALGHARPEELFGQNAGAIVHPDDRLRARELTSRAHPSRADGRAHELRYRKANGEYALMEIRPAVLSEFEGAPAVLITARDVTERRKMQAQLHVTERLVSVGTLAAGVAHEVNNPLAALVSSLDWISGRVSHLLAQEGEPDQVRAAAVLAELRRIDKPLSDALDAAARVRAIMRDLKLFSRAEDEREGSVELTPVLDSAARMASNELRHRARYVRDYGEQLPTVHGSDARLGQVFLNLIINAAHAIPEGHAHEHEIRVSVNTPSLEHVVVEVRDTGSGMAPEVLDRIFDPFFTTKPAGIGTGLGLAICHRIVTSVGGRIDAQSQPGKGSVFRVTLRRAEPAQAARPPSPPTPVPESGLRGHVLVIDDDPVLANAIGLVLGDHHEVDVLTGARQALARLREGAHYDAIVCDVMMPEMSGAEFHEELARVQPELAGRVIFLSGGAFTVQARDFLDRIDNPRLDKPFDAETLRALVDRQVARRAREHPDRAE
jgi:PAS domain S-box-containing protein